ALPPGTRSHRGTGGPVPYQVLGWYARQQEIAPGRMDRTRMSPYFRHRIAFLLVSFQYALLPEPERHRSRSASKTCVIVSSSHGSSIAWRLSRAPLTAVWFFDRLQVAAMVVEQLQVVDARCPAAIARDQVIHFHPISF